ncbi:phosphoadenylyl-sulfate reductase [Anaerolineales bacterium HSG6]|nr:phosphoadenylyl-sulfate reductase [Anaerolineales bacterium HSG6]MDM8530775.1 phosphoadenylyl-sulfate reductase [Anaerolineales bacterium HSG25]
MNPVQSLDLPALNEKLEHASTPQILAWAWDTFGPKIASSSSFQTQSVPLIHLISQTCPDMPIVFLDTGFHFPETLTFRNQLESAYNLNIMNIYPSVDQSQLFYQYGEGLYRSDPDLCCHINKVEPMQRAVEGFEAWISGVRRDQTEHRAGLRVLEEQSNGLLRIHPMLRWTKREVWAYIDEHTLPSHPLFEQGYMSIGCAPCTRPVFSEQDEREGRWGGAIKTECGLHLDIKRDE